MSVLLEPQFSFLETSLVSACLVPLHQGLMLGKTELKTFVLGKTELRIFVLGKTEMKILMLGKNNFQKFLFEFNASNLLVGSLTFLHCSSDCSYALSWMAEGDTCRRNHRLLPHVPSFVPHRKVPCQVYVLHTLPYAYMLSEERFRQDVGGRSPGVARCQRCIKRWRCHDCTTS